MNKIIIFSILLFFSLFTTAQTIDKNLIFSKILENNILDTKPYISCEQTKTYFDSTQFNSKTGLEVPSEILEELEQASKESKEGVWHQIFTNKSDHLKRFLKSDNCLEKREIEQLFAKSNKRHQVFLITNPIFDNDNLHCVVSFVCMNQKGSAYGNSYFLKKVYGVWVIISVYDVWIT